MVSWIGLIFGILVALGVIAWFKDWWLAKWRIRWGPPAPGTHFTILVAQLDNDADNSQQKHIRQSLEAQFRGAGADARMHIDIYPDTLRLKTGEIGAALLDAEKKGRDWLWQRNADILIWGEVADANKLLRLRFTTADAATDSAKPYSLTEMLELPADFGADFGAVLATLAATGIQPIYEEAGQALAEIIEPIVGKLRPLAANPPASFSDDDKAGLWHAYAAGEQQLGKERGDNARLATAIGFYRKVLGIRSRERVPLDWATTQNNLGTALASLGERESGTARLEEAVAAYREALTERTRERVPLTGR